VKKARRLLVATLVGATLTMGLIAGASAGSPEFPPGYCVSSYAQNQQFEAGHPRYPGASGLARYCQDLAFYD